jgi:hypothetical protein
MDPDLVAAFAAEYIAERNRLAATKTDISAAMRKDLAKVIKDQDMLVNAILAGTPAERIKDRMAQLEQRQKQLEKDLAAAPASTAVLHIHPGMATDYQSRIKALIDGLTDAESEGEAKEAIRGLIEKIVATPVPTKGKRSTLSLTLHGNLAGILAMSLNADLMSGQQKTSCEQEVMESVGLMVAGGRFAIWFRYPRGRGPDRGATAKLGADQKFCTHRGDLFAPVFQRQQPA